MPKSIIVILKLSLIFVVLTPKEALSFSCISRKYIRFVRIAHKTGFRKDLSEKRFYKPHLPTLHRKSSAKDISNVDAGKNMPLGGDSFSSKSIINPVVNAKKECMNYGILISSFTDGIEKPFLAKEFLKYSLSRAFAKDAVLRKEEEVRKSVLKSPCAGPNIEDLNDLEKLDTDAMVSDGEMFFNEDGENQAIDNSVNILLRSLIGDGEIPLDLRVLYIPTALYALKKDSKNTPGKQRQRARADGKKRRNAIVRLLGELFHKHKGVRVLAITLDLDDGSLKQPQGTEDMSFFPEGGEEALNSWRPHLIYVEGGNTFWLQHCIEKGNWLNQIKSACVGPNASAVYVGKSAGAIICGKNVETATWKVS